MAALLSYWEKNYILRGFDYVIIGSGITGLQAAIYLKRQDRTLRVGVLERGMLPQGASTRNAGFACFGNLSEILSDCKHMHPAEVEQLVLNRWAGLEILKSEFNPTDIGLEMNGGYELFTSDQNALYNRCIAALPEWNERLSRDIGSDVFQPADQELRKIQFKGAVHALHNPYEGQLNTGLLMLRLTELARETGVEIFNGIAVKKWAEDSSNVLVDTDLGAISCKYLICCVNGFYKEFDSHADVTATRAQVLITEPIPNLHLKGIFHSDEGYYYWRNIDGRILLGGARNVAFQEEDTASRQTSEPIQQALEAFLRNLILPGYTGRIQMQWAGTMGMGRSGKQPIVKKLSARTGCAVRFGGMGVALGNLMGRRIALEMLN